MIRLRLWGLKLAQLAASCLWASLNRGARFLQDFHVLRSHKLPVRVISVGNIQAGGAGKTPVVAFLAQQAMSLGLRVCILIRGYRGAWEHAGCIIWPDSPEVGVEECGDEAALLKHLCPQAIIGVGANRLLQFETIWQHEQGNVDCVILDDGFQNWQIKKDLELVVLTSARFSERLFRDWPSAVKRANLLLWTKGEIPPPSFGLPLLQVRFALDAVPGVKVWLVAGVGDPQSVLQLASQAGYVVVQKYFFADHFHYEEEQVRGLLKQAAGDRCRVALTGKDWVKWKALGVLEKEVLILEPRLEFRQGQEVWSKVLWG
ncbi:MAG: tetraacyldisaccharide 4'-kinase [Bdellovibrionia bacterium]